MNRETRERKLQLLSQFKAPTDFRLKASGIIAEVVRPPLSGWVATGQVPEGLFNAASSAVRAGSDVTEKAVQSLPDVFALALKIVRASFKWPRPTEEGRPAAAEDEFEPETLPPPDLAQVLEWAFEGSPNVPVETTSGVIEPKALDNFREGSELPSPGGDGGDVREESGG